jgi:hypothetical protein
MEEVVGSIPTRSTSSLNKLDGTSRHGRLICVITRRFSACGKDSNAFRFASILTCEYRSRHASRPLVALEEF